MMNRNISFHEKLFIQYNKNSISIEICLCVQNQDCIDFHSPSDEGGIGGL